MSDQMNSDGVTVPRVRGAPVVKRVAPRSRLGRFGDGIYELVSQLGEQEQDALLRRGGYGLILRLGLDGMPEAALMFDPDHPESRRVLRSTRLRGERLA